MFSVAVLSTLVVVSVMLVGASVASVGVVVVSTGSVEGAASRVSRPSRSFAMNRTFEEARVGGSRRGGKTREGITNAEPMGTAIAATTRAENRIV